MCRIRKKLTMSFVKRSTATTDAMAWPRDEQVKDWFYSFGQSMNDDVMYDYGQSEADNFDPRDVAILGGDPSL